MSLFFPSLVSRVSFMGYDTETVGLYGLEANCHSGTETSMQDVRKEGGKEDI
jgi:hypothetical protein